MPSYSLRRWQTDRLPRLSALEGQVAATPPSTLADENLRALVAMLCAHFQGFCRDLYIEAAESVVRTSPAHLTGVVRKQFLAQMVLNTGNPNLQTLDRDFDRFELDLKAELNRVAGNALRLNHLALLNQWRNFVVHHGLTAPAGSSLALPAVQAWLVSCGELATELDRIVYDHLRALLGAPPW